MKYASIRFEHAIECHVKRAAENVFEVFFTSFFSIHFVTIDHTSFFGAITIHSRRHSAQCDVCYVAVCHRLLLLLLCVYFMCNCVLCIQLDPPCRHFQIAYDKWQMNIITISEIVDFHFINPNIHGIDGVHRTVAWTARMRWGRIGHQTIVKIISTF